MARLQSLNDAPATQREYETIYILRPTTANDGVAEVNTRVKNIIETMGGKVLKVDNWGKRRLAYEVAKERKGIYLYWQYLANPGVVEEFERNLRMLDSVIRYLTIKVDVDVDPGAKPGEIDAEAYDRAANTAADEEDLFLSRPNDDGGRHDDEFGNYDDDDGDVIPGSALNKDKDKDAAAKDKDAAAKDKDKDKDKDAAAKDKDVVAAVAPVKDEE